VNVQIVPYRNSPDIVVALLRNDVQMLVEFPAAIKGQVADGKLRLLATSGPKRSSSVPDLPTVAEAGVEGYEVTSWNGVFAPKGTATEVVAIVNKALAEVLAMPDVKQKFAELGIEARSSSPDELMAVFKSDVQKWDGVIAKAGIERK
jgi:tripartite-type tricarboxylate transporter receptor subunit TctC